MTRFRFNPYRRLPALHGSAGRALRGSAGRALRVPTLLLIGCLAWAPALLASERLTITGVVRSSSGVLAGTTVTATPSGRNARSGSDGRYTIEVDSADRALTASRGGYKSSAASLEIRDARVRAEIDFTLQPEAKISESIVVSAIRAGETTPITKRDLDREEIEKLNYGQEIPFLLDRTPSIVSYSDAGSGTGYAYFTLRGINQTRINLTLDGVPLNDSEDMNAYFANYGDFTNLLDSIQIQRGVGTSTVGSPAFGGSVNFTSVNLSPTKKLEAEVGGGSFGTARATVAWHSGLLGESGIALHGRASAKQSDGFRDHSGVRQRTFFAVASKEGESSMFKFTAFSGKERSQLAFFATDEETLDRDLRFNPLDEKETDRFGQDFVQLQVLRQLGSTTALAGSVYFNRGYGAYELWSDATHTQLNRYGLDGRLVGGMVSLSRRTSGLTLDYGLHYSDFHRDHSLTALGAIDRRSQERLYDNTGFKRETTAFAKAGYDRGPWHLFGDLQLRHADFRYEGDVAIDPIDWTFINPKLGARYRLSPAAGIYVSLGSATREPARNDFFSGQDNPTVAHDLHLVRPERVIDGELGLDLEGERLSFHGNVYAMEFRDEIAATGELSEIGLLLRRNVERSYRRGIELDVSYEVTPRLTLRNSTNLSRNRISEWTQFYDVYDAAGSLAESTPIIHRRVDPLLTPTAIVNQRIELRATRAMSAGANLRYVSKSQLDNTNDRDFVTPSYFTADLDGSLALGAWIPAGRPRLRIQINNLFDNRQIYPSGYSYRFINAGQDKVRTISGTSYFYPLATRSVFVTLDFKM